MLPPGDSSPSRSAQLLSSPDTSTVKKSKPTHYYAVARGRRVGIFTSWAAAQNSTDRFPSCKHKKFDEIESAISFMNEHLGASYIPEIIGSDLAAVALENEFYCSSVNGDSDVMFNLQASATRQSTPYTQEPPKVDVVNCDNQQSPDVRQLKMLNVNICQLNATLITLTQTLNNLPTLLKQSTAELRTDITQPIISAVCQPLNNLNERLSSIDLLLDPNTQRSSKSFTCRSATSTTTLSLPRTDQDTCPPSLTDKGPITSALPNTTKPDKLYSNISKHTTKEANKDQISHKSPPDSVHRSSPRMVKVNTKIPFKAEKCIVITNISKEHATSLNQDDIRSAINKQFGPVFIDMINRYKFHGDAPKFVVQFADSATAEKIVKGWSNELLHGSSARLTQKPKTCIGIIKGVPLYMTDEDISTDLQTKYDNTSVYRLKGQDGRPLRTIKITFNDDAELTDAMDNGVVLHRILCRVEKPYSSIPPNNTTQQQNA
jgi:hypothetical protein